MGRQALSFHATKDYASYLRFRWTVVEHGADLLPGESNHCRALWEDVYARDASDDYGQAGFGLRSDIGKGIGPAAECSGAFAGAQ